MTILVPVFYPCFSSHFVHKDDYSSSCHCGALVCYFRGEFSFPDNLQLFNVFSTKQTKQLDGNLPSELDEFLNEFQILSFDAFYVSFLLSIIFVHFYF